MSDDFDSETDHNHIQSAIDAGESLADVGARIVMFPPEADVQVPVIYYEGKTLLAKDVLDALDARRETPLRRRGGLVLTEVASFVEAVNRWGSDRTVIYADASAFKLEAVTDDHPAGDEAVMAPGWRGHRIAYTCPRSSEWQAWSAIDGKELPQVGFGDFLESRLEDLIAAEGYPRPLEMLEVARKLSIRTKGEFTRQHDPTTGNHILVSKSEHTSDSTPIPRAFRLAIPVFEGGLRYELEARIRLRVDGAAFFTVVLHRRKEIERDAFMAVRQSVASDTKRLVLAGTP